MKVYVKSAGHRDTQDYVWLCVSGANDEADVELLSEAERKTLNRGNVVSWVDSKSKVKRVLFVGNAVSGRSDFYGTPILTHLGLVLDPKVKDEQRFAEQIANDWMNAPVLIAQILKVCVVAADTVCGFSCNPDIVDRLKSAMARTGTATSAVVTTTIGNITTNDKPTVDKLTVKEDRMHISIHTVPSGEQDYEWCFGGRPTYANKLWDIAERVRTTDGNKVFFAVVAHEMGNWILFVRDIVGKDTIVRPARDAGCTLAIEIPDQDNGAVEIRRLLVAWLEGRGELRNSIVRAINRDGTEVKVDKERLYEAVRSVACADTYPLGNEKLRDSRQQYIVRLAKDLSDREEIRNLAADFVRRFQFQDKDGVHFLFASTPYSSRRNDPDYLPNISAQLVVLGHRDGEQGVTVEKLRQIIKENNGEKTPLPPPPPPLPPPAPPWYVRYVIIEIIAIAVILLTLIISLFSGEDSDESQAKDRTEASCVSSTNNLTANKLLKP